MSIELQFDWSEGKLEIKIFGMPNLEEAEMVSFEKLLTMDVRSAVGE